MKYTRYYSRVLKAHGIPHISVDQQCRLMNIVSLEGRLSELESLKKDLKLSSEAHNYDVKIYKVKQQILGLTADVYPKDLFNEMIVKSR